jgi:hypothetical protein
MVIPTIAIVRILIKVSHQPGVIMLLAGMDAQGAGRYIFGSLKRFFCVADWGCAAGVLARICAG